MHVSCVQDARQAQERVIYKDRYTKIDIRKIDIQNM